MCKGSSWSLCKQPACVNHFSLSVEKLARPKNGPSLSVGCEVLFHDDSFQRTIEAYYAIAIATPSD